MNSKLVIFVLVVALALEAKAGSGCHKGYCWTSCTGAGAYIAGDNKEWCYTTKGRSQDYQYVKCSRDRGCISTWKCAGPCSL